MIFLITFSQAVHNRLNEVFMEDGYWCVEENIVEEEVDDEHGSEGEDQVPHHPLDHKEVQKPSK